MYNFLAAATILLSIKIVSGDPTPCEGRDIANSKYLLNLPDSIPGARNLPDEASELLKDFVDTLNDEGGYLGERDVLDEEYMTIAVGAKPLSPYPPAGDTSSSSSGGDPNGKPTPLYIKREDIAKCIEHLREIVNETPGFKETDIETIHTETRRIVAGGEIVVVNA